MQLWEDEGEFEGKEGGRCELKLYQVFLIRATRTIIVNIYYYVQESEGEEDVNVR